MKSNDDSHAHIYTTWIALKMQFSDEETEILKKKKLNWIIYSCKLPIVLIINHFFVNY